MEYLRKNTYTFLRSLESKFQTDMVYLVKGGFWLTFGNIFASGLSFLMGIVFANKLLPETYGTYKFTLSILGLLSITTLSGMGGILSQAVSRGFEGSFLQALKTKISWGLLGAAGSIIVSVYYFTNDNTQLAITFLIATAFIPFLDSFVIYQDYLQGKRLFNVYTISTSISQVFSTLTMITVLFLTNNLYLIFLTYLTSWTLARSFFFLRTYKKYPPNKEVDPRTISYGKHTSFIDIIATFIGSLDQILIFHYLGAVELAVYSFAIAPIIQLTSLFRNIPTLAMPKMAARPVKHINILLKKRVFIGFAVAFLITFLYIIFSPLMYKLLFPQYLKSVPFSQVYALTMLLTIPLTIFSAAINSKTVNVPKKMLFLWNIPGFLSTIFIFSFIQFTGVYAVIWARIVLLIATFSISLIFWRYIVKKDKEQPTPHTSPISDTTPESQPHNAP